MQVFQLIEGISPILYHMTSIYAAGKIVTENRFKLSASFGNDSEQQVGSQKHFFLSTTRSRMGGYTVRGAYDGHVIMVLDGKKLAHNYSGGPVQYWDRSMIALDHKYDETEDRVYADEPYIENATKFITKRRQYVTLKI